VSSNNKARLFTKTTKYLSSLHLRELPHPEELTQILISAVSLSTSAETDLQSNQIQLPKSQTTRR
jgi:hypothetical protein